MTEQFPLSKTQSFQVHTVIKIIGIVNIRQLFIPRMNEIIELGIRICVTGTKEITELQVIIRIVTLTN
jgi:hypothetical protein